MGFTEVYDFPTGILDWMGAGLPTEGTNAERPRLVDIVRRDVPTCAPGELVGDVRDRVTAAGWNACVVTNDDQVVLGLLRAAELESDRTLPVARAMRPGPSTYRPHVSVEEMAGIMAKHDLENFPVTTSDGKLIGLVRREDVGGV